MGYECFENCIIFSTTSPFDLYSLYTYTALFWKRRQKPRTLKVAMFTSKLYVRNPHVCFMNWIIPSSRAIFVRRTTKIARELKTDKGSLQLKKEKTITRESVKYRDLKENIRTTHQKVNLRAGLSLITIMWLNNSTRCDQNYDFQNTSRYVRLRWIKAKCKQT